MRKVFIFLVVGIILVTSVSVFFGLSMKLALDSREKIRNEVPPKANWSYVDDGKFNSTHDLQSTFKLTTPNKITSKVAKVEWRATGIQEFGYSLELCYINNDTSIVLWENTHPTMNSTAIDSQSGTYFFNGPCEVFLKMTMLESCEFSSWQKVEV
jgi:hypothetical protein